MVSVIGLIICIVAGVNAAWSGFWFLMAVSGTAGAKISKNTRFANSQTDTNIEEGGNMAKNFLHSFLWRAGIALIGYLAYVFAA